jgi:putative tryptophan/tyrosine transport system substrate-binding protein
LTQLRHRRAYFAVTHNRPFGRLCPRRPISHETAQLHRSADAERIRAYAIELVGLKPDVIVVSTSLVLQPLQRETRSIPIVFTQITDPVGSGFVESLARPGGNITGFTPAEFSMFGKSLEVLKEVAPHVTRVAIILNPEQAPQLGMWHAINCRAVV